MNQEQIRDGECSMCYSDVEECGCDAYPAGSFLGCDNCGWRIREDVSVLIMSRQLCWGCCRNLQCECGKTLIDNGYEFVCECGETYEVNN